MNLPININVWLETLTLSQYSNNFMQNGYDTLEKCINLEEDDLKDIGIILPGHVKRILKNIEIIKQMSMQSRYGTTGFTSMSSIDTSSSEGTSDGNIYAIPKSYQPTSYYDNDESSMKSPIGFDKDIKFTDRNMDTFPYKNLSNTNTCKPSPLPRNSLKKNISQDDNKNLTLVPIGNNIISNFNNSLILNNKLNMSISDLNISINSPDSEYLQSQSSFYDSIQFEDISGDYIPMNIPDVVSSPLQNSNTLPSPQINPISLLNINYLQSQTNKNSKSNAIYADINESGIYSNTEFSKIIINKSVKSFNEPLFSELDCAEFDNWSNDHILNKFQKNNLEIEEGEDTTSNRSSIPPPCYSPPPLPSEVDINFVPEIPVRFNVLNTSASDLISNKFNYLAENENNQIIREDKPCYPLLDFSQFNKEFNDDYLLPNKFTMSSENNINVALNQQSIENQIISFSDQNIDIIDDGFLKKCDGRSKNDSNLKWVQIKEDTLEFFEKDKVTLNFEIEYHKIRYISLISTKSLEYPFEISLKSSRSNVSLIADTFINRGLWLDSIARKMAKYFVNLCELSKINNIQFGAFAQVEIKIPNNTMNEITYWLHIKDRRLYLCGENDFFKDYDLRKSRNIKISDDSSSFTIDFYNGLLIIRDSQTNVWYQIFNKHILTFDKNRISEQFLSTDNIPIFVDKCILFIKTHGLHTEGIYRLSGQDSKVTKLYELLLSDARSVQLLNNVEDYTVHEVSNALKRFFRLLDSPLLTNDLHQPLSICSSMNDQKKKVQSYRSILAKLPLVNYSTLRYLLGHLLRVSKFKSENKMDIINLASIFGPILMSFQNEFTSASGDMAVVKDFLDNYDSIFNVSLEEANRNEKIEEAMIRIKSLNHDRTLSIDDSHIFKEGVLYEFAVGNEDNEVVVNLMITNTMMAEDVIEKLIEKTEFDTTPSWCLFEVICNHDLERVIEKREMMLELVMKYKHWPTEFCQKIKLVFKENNYLDSLLLMAGAESNMPLYSELKFSSYKSFKKYHFEFTKCRLSYRKDSKSANIESSWKAEDIIVYFGIPSNRQSNNFEYGFTFYDKSLGLNSQYFGYSIICINEEERFRWMSTILKAQYPEYYSIPPDTPTLRQSSNQHVANTNSTTLKPVNRLLNILSRK